MPHSSLGRVLLNDGGVVLFTHLQPTSASLVAWCDDEDQAERIDYGDIFAIELAAVLLLEAAPAIP
jgi:hypothetical protein